MIVKKFLIFAAFAAFAGLKDARPAQAASGPPASKTTPGGVGKARTQKIDIYFNYVGQVNIAYTEKEMAEMKAKEEQAEQKRLAREQ